MTRIAPLSPVPPRGREDASARARLFSHAHQGARSAAEGLLARLEHAFYRRLANFLARRFRWEAAVERGTEDGDRWSVYATLMDRIAADMSAHDPAFLDSHPPLRPGRLRVIK